MNKAEEWTTQARRELARLRGPAGAWGYRGGTTPAVEPTALAALGFLGSAPSPRDAESLSTATAAADWLAAVQRRDGSLRVAPGGTSPGWTTSYGSLLWGAVGGHDSRRRLATAWLLGEAGKTVPRSADPEHIVGHDTTLVGWPWVSATHSWLEPTAMAVLALRGDGAGGNPRTVEGIRLIRDRAIEGGGWNYGNKAAFGRPLRPQPAPTGLALLALRGETSGDAAVIADAVTYLRAILPTTRSASALGWGILGLRAWGRVPLEAASWLAESHARVAGRPDASTRLAMLLLAVGEHSLGLFDGIGRGTRRGDRID